MKHATSSATYRLQLTPDFGFDAVAQVADYLRALGISHVYCSPYFQAAPGSRHGYDVVDHSRPNDELGGSDAHARMTAALERAGLGQVLDIVPNHMAIAAGNRWWWDVLEHGPASYHARYFDVDWDPPETRLKNVVLLPVLGQQYGRALEAGELVLLRDGPLFRIRYFDQYWPIDPQTLGPLLSDAARRAGSAALAFIAEAFDRLPRPATADTATVQVRQRDMHVLRTLLANLLRTRAIEAAVDAAVQAANADPDRLDGLLERQNYRLAWWRAAGRDLGYRRFFDVNSLVGIRTERPEVFDDTHRLVLGWLREGRLAGVRVDHPDGLRDPEGYLERLRGAAPGAWIVVEKILAHDEALPASWPVAGTTGYDFMNRVLGVLVDPEGEKPLSAFYREFTEAAADFTDVAYRSRLAVLREVLGSDVNRLAALFLAVCERHRRYRDFSRHDLTEGLREVVAAFPVYRTYVRPALGAVSATDRAHVAVALAAAREWRPDLDPTLFEFLGKLLTLEVRGALEDEFVERFQQLTGPAMAKGVEDTAFYRYARFCALNEVGGEPGRFGLSVDDFHAASARAQERWPDAMLATATHDSKRGEDVRARLALLSEIPDDWIAAVTRWSALTARHRRDGLPDRNTEYFFYQTLVGAWPLSVERAVAYMEKAVREAKEHTAWLKPEPRYEAAVRAFVEGALGDAEFRADLERFLAPLLTPGRVVSLAQTLLKLSAPGVPDLYQGTELWSLDLVDPDNRRPVDFARRRALLAECEGLGAEAVLARMDEGLPKLFVIARTLRVRALRRTVFARGCYAPLTARGEKARHVLAFQRGEDIVVVVPRLVLGLGAAWGTTELTLPAGTWVDAFTEARRASGACLLEEVLGRFPVALLTRT